MGRPGGTDPRRLGWPAHAESRRACRAREFTVGSWCETDPRAPPPLFFPPPPPPTSDRPFPSDRLILPGTAAASRTPATRAPRRRRAVSSGVGDFTDRSAHTHNGGLGGLIEGGWSSWSGPRASASLMEGVNEMAWRRNTRTFALALVPVALLGQCSPDGCAPSAPPEPAGNYPTGQCDDLTSGLPGLNSPDFVPASLRQIGTSAGGRPIYAEYWGVTHAAEVVLVIGQIHGNECAPSLCRTTTPEPSGRLRHLVDPDAEPRRLRG